MYLSAHTVFTGNHAVVQVIANEVDRYSSKRTLTNSFTYVFSSDLDGDTPADSERYVQVMPREYDEFVLFLEGRRSLDLALAVEPTASKCTVNRDI
mgnify:CR=1 FL=1